MIMIMRKRPYFPLFLSFSYWYTGYDQSIFRFTVIMYVSFQEPYISHAVFVPLRLRSRILAAIESKKKLLKSITANAF